MNELENVSRETFVLIGGIKMVVDLENRRKRKAFEANMGKEKLSATYEKGSFVVTKILEGGKILLTKNNKDYPILMEYPKYKQIEEGEIIRCMLFKKVFYVYWELAYTY